jgi:SAM-dependent methyltransferase
MPSHPPTAAPSDWVLRGLRALKPGQSVLDFACGSGRHARAAASLGLRVTAVDRDALALATIDSTISCRVADLESGAWPFSDERFDAVIVANYLFRPRIDLLLDRVAPGGLLIYETFAQGHEAYGRPSNPAFLLQAGELLKAADRAGLMVLAYEHGDLARPARVQRILAVRPPFDWAAHRLDLTGSGAAG